jgi:ankyrin repeat protein
MEDENDENRPEAQAVDLLEDLDFFLRNQHHPSGKTPSAEVCSDCARSKSQLLRATSNGHIGCVEAALAENRSVSSCRTPQGATAAHIAAKRGDSNILMKLTEADPTCVSARDTRGTTPTHVSAYNGKYGCLRVLVQSAGSANEKAQDGATPLHLAAATGHMDCLEYLVTDAGGMVDNCTNSGATPGLLRFRNFRFVCRGPFRHRASRAFLTRPSLCSLLRCTRRPPRLSAMARVGC